MKSEDLKITQRVLETLIKEEIDDPMTDYKKVISLTKIIKHVDTLRRKTWNNEKFGASEVLAEETYFLGSKENETFTSDDIPF